jgi:homopolymeric O-antigen transport system ATP-binding protein
MTDIAIRAEGLGKRYRLGQDGEAYGRITEVLSNKLRAPFRRSQPSHIEDFWALRDVAFEVPVGAAMGIIGRNGAGKSTLLKVLSRITWPTTGSATLYGRIASLLEVGTGFHPELSGTENVYLSGAVLGMKHAEIKRNFDEIVDFSGIDPKFLDTPVKRYSSGMQVRLGFAVAAHLESEILLIDEVLAVGDIEFQKRCLGKMDEVANSGRTILFVSHQLPMIASLCDHCLLMEGGRVIASGPTSDVIHRYQAGVGTNAASVDYLDEATRPGDGVVSLLSAWVENGSGERRFEHSLMDPIRIRVKYRVHEQLSATPQPNLHVTDSAGNYVFVTSPHDWGDDRARSPGDYLAAVEIPGHFLNDGMYSVGVAVNHFKSGLRTAFFERGALSFNIVDRFDDNQVRAVSRWGGRIPGAVRPLLPWKVEEAEAQDAVVAEAAVDEAVAEKATP